MIDFDSALTLVSRVLVIPRIADDLLSYSSRRNALEALRENEGRRAERGIDAKFHEWGTSNSHEGHVAYLA